MCPLDKVAFALAAVVASVAVQVHGCGNEQVFEQHPTQHGFNFSNARIGDTCRHLGPFALERKNAILDAGLLALAAAMDKPTCKVSLVYLQECKLTDVSIIALAKVLEKNLYVERLELQDNFIGPAGAKALAAMLKVNTVLKHVVLRNNQIGDEGAIYFAEAFLSNKDKRSTVLDLEKNEIGDAGAAKIGEMMAVNTHLKEINLKQNHIGDAGAIAIGQGLAKNTKLNLLNLDGNEIGDAGVAGLGEALKENKKLEDLVLMHNKIGDAGADSLVEALKCCNRKLRFIGNLGLYGNPASYKQKVKVEKMARADRSEFDHTEL